MKKLLLILLCFPLLGFGQGQVNCSLLNVTDVVIDNTNMTIDIAIYNGDTMDTHYPFIAYTIDALGDTIQNGNINWFVTPALDTSWYNYNILNPITPIYPLSIYFVHSNFTGPNPGEDTCILSYHPSCDSVITSFTQIDSSSTPHLIHFDIQTFEFRIQKSHSIPDTSPSRYHSCLQRDLSEEHGPLSGCSNSATQTLATRLWEFRWAARISESLTLPIN